MMNVVKFRLPGLCLGGFLFMSLVLGGCKESSSPDWSVKVGDDVPAFKLEDVLTGETITSEGMLGKPYIVTIFATWCPPCKRELLDLQGNAWEDVKTRGAGVIGINFGDEDSRTIAEFAENHELSFPLLVDQAGEFRKAVGATMVPQSMVIDSKGKIVELHLGYTEESVMDMKTRVLKETGK